jgi:hypothetical protein
MNEMTAFNEDADPNIAAAAVELAAAIADAVNDGKHLLDNGIVGYDKWQQGAAEEKQRGGAGADGAASKTAAASMQSRRDFGIENDVGIGSDAGGQCGRQIREVKGLEGEAICTYGYSERRPTPHCRPWLS